MYVNSKSRALAAATINEQIVLSLSRDFPKNLAYLDNFHRFAPVKKDISKTNLFLFLYAISEKGLDTYREAQRTDVPILTIGIRR